MHRAQRAHVVIHDPLNIEDLKLHEATQRSERDVALPRCEFAQRGGQSVGTADDVSTMDDATYVEPSRGPKKRASTRVAFKSETEPREAASVEDKVEEPRRVTRASAKAAGTAVPPLKYHF